MANRDVAVAVNTSQLGPVTSAADGAARALVCALVSTAAVRRARDDTLSLAGCLGLTSPLALICVALIRMYCELISSYCYSALFVITCQIQPSASPPSALVAPCQVFL